MFEGEKTLIFWIGLIIFGLAAVGLFAIIWTIAVWYPYGTDPWNALKGIVPFIVGGVVFIFIGWYMMKSGVKKQPCLRVMYRNKEKKDRVVSEEEKDEIARTLVDVLLSESWRWIKLYFVGYIPITANAILLINLPLPFTLSTAAQIDIASLDAIATSVSITYGLISFIILQPSYLRLSHKLWIMLINTIHLSGFAYGVYLLISGRLLPEFHGGIVDAFYVFFSLMLYTVIFLAYCSMDYYQKIEIIKIAKFKGSLEELAETVGLTAEELFEKTEEKRKSRKEGISHE